MEFWHSAKVESYQWSGKNPTSLVNQSFKREKGLEKDTGQEGSAKWKWFQKRIMSWNPGEEQISAISCVCVCVCVCSEGRWRLIANISRELWRKERNQCGVCWGGEGRGEVARRNLQKGCIYYFNRNTVALEILFCCSVTQLCLTLWDPMDCSTPSFPVLHHLPELAQTYGHWVSDAIQPSCPLSSPSLLAFNLSQHQSLFQMSWLFASGGQSIGASASASVLPMNIQDLFPLGLTGWISLQSKGLPRVFSNTTVQKHQFFGAQPSLWSNSHFHTWLLEKPLKSHYFLTLTSSIASHRMGVIIWYTTLWERGMSSDSKPEPRCKTLSWNERDSASLDVHELKPSQGSYYGWCQNGVFIWAKHQAWGQAMSGSIACVVSLLVCLLWALCVFLLL